MADEKTQIITEKMTLHDDFYLDETYLISTGLENTGVSVVRGSLTVDGTHFTENKLAIYLSPTSDACTITNAEFSSNVLGIYAETETDLTVTNSVFTGDDTTENSAIYRDALGYGNTTFENCTFSNFTVNSNDSVIYYNGNGYSEFLLKNCRFSDSYVSTAKGYNLSDNGIIYADRGRMVVEDSSFSNITTADSFLCGAVFTARASSLSVSNSNFSNNSSNTGTAFYATDSSSLTLDDITISNCFASQYGGGIYVQDSSLSITNSNFSDNGYGSGSTITAYGGAIYASASTVTVKDSFFYGNQAANDGAIYAAENSSLAIEDCVFGETTDRIFLSGSQLRLSGTNYFSSDILLDPNAGSTITVTNGTVGFLPHHQDAASTEIFDLNKLEYTSGTYKSYAVEAGNIAADGTYYLAKNIQKQGTVILYVDGINIGSLDLYNQSSRTYCYDKWKYTLAISDANGSTCLSVSRVETSENQAVVIKSGETRGFDSGDVFRDLSYADSNTYAAITNNGTLSVDGTLFQDNSISGVRNYGTAEIRNAVFEGHDSQSALRNAKGSVTIENTNFICNSGTALYADAGTITISNSIFSGNSGKYAGAVYNTNAQITLKECCFTTSTDTINLANDSMIYLEGVNYFAGAIEGRYRAVNMTGDCVFGFYLNNYEKLDTAYIDGYVICPRLDTSFVCSVSMTSSQRGTFVFAENFNKNYLGFDVTQINLVVDGVESGSIFANSETAFQVGNALYSFANDNGTLSVTVSNVPIEHAIRLNADFTEDNVPEGYTFGFDAFSDPDTAITAALENSTNLEISGGSFTNLLHFQGVETEMLTGSFSEKNLYADGGRFTVSGGIISSALHGGNGLDDTYTEETFISVSGGILHSIYGGGYNNSGTGTTNILMTQGEVEAIYGGGREGARVITSNVTVSGGETTDYIYGGGKSGGDVENVFLSVSGGTHRNIYGGSSEGSVSGNIVLTVSGGKMNYIHGAGYYDSVAGNITVTVTGGTAKALYAFGMSSTVDGSSTVNISGGTITTGVYGRNRGSEPDGADESVLNLSGNYTFTADTVIDNFDKINFTVNYDFCGDTQRYYLLSAGNFNIENTVVTINGVSETERGFYNFEQNGKTYTYYLINTGSEIALSSVQKGVILCQNGEIVDSFDEVSSVSLSGSGTYRTMLVLESGKASEISVGENGMLLVGNGGAVSGAEAEDGSKVAINNGSINDLALHANSTLVTISGGSLLNLTIDDNALLNIKTKDLSGFSGNTSKGEFELDGNTLKNFFITVGSSFTVNSSNFAFSEKLSVAGNLILKETASFDNTVIALDLASGNDASLLSGWEKAEGTYTVSMLLDQKEAAEIGIYTLADSRIATAELVIDHVSYGTFANGEKRVIDNGSNSLNYRLYTDETSGETALYIYDLAVKVDFPDIWQDAPTELQELDHSAVLSDEKVYFEIGNGVGAYINGSSVATIYGAGDTAVEQDVYLYVANSVFNITGGGKNADTTGDIYIYAAPGVTIDTVILGGENGINTGNADLYICNSSVNNVKRGNLIGTATVTVDNKLFSGTVENIDELELLNNSRWQIAENSLLDDGMRVVISLDNRNVSADAIIYSGNTVSLKGSLDITAQETPADGIWQLCSNIDLSDVQITINGNLFTNNSLFYNGVLYTLEEQNTDLYLNVESKWLTPVFPENWENMPERLSDMSFADSGFIADADISYTLTDGIGGALKDSTLTSDLYAGFSDNRSYTGNTYLYFGNVNTSTVSAGTDGVLDTEDDVVFTADIYGSGNETRTGDIFIALDGGTYTNIYGAGSGSVTGSLSVSIANNASVSGIISGKNVSGKRLLLVEETAGSYTVEAFNAFELIDSTVTLNAANAMTSDISITVNDLSDFTVAPALTVTGENSISVADLTLNLDFASSARGEWIIAAGLDWSNLRSITVNGEIYTLGEKIFNLRSGNDLTLTVNEDNVLVLSSEKDPRLYIVYDDYASNLAAHDRFNVQDNFYYGVINAENSKVDGEIFYLGDPEDPAKKVQLDIKEGSDVSNTTFDINNCEEISLNAAMTTIAGITGSAAGCIDLSNAVILGEINCANADITISGEDAKHFDGITANKLTITGGQITCDERDIFAETIEFSGGRIDGNITDSGKVTISGGKIYGNLNNIDELVISGGIISGKINDAGNIEFRSGSSETYSGIETLTGNTLHIYVNVPELKGSWTLDEVYVYEDSVINFDHNITFQTKEFHIESGRTEMVFDNEKRFEMDKIWIEEGAVWQLTLQNNSDITVKEIERKVDLIGNDGLINISVSGGSKLTFDDWSISSNDTTFNELCISSDSTVTFKRKVLLKLNSNDKAIKNEGTLIFDGDVDISCTNDSGDKVVDLAEKGAETIFNADSEINGDINIAGTVTINDSMRIGDLSDITNALNLWGTTEVNTSSDSRIDINNGGDLILGTDTSVIGDLADWSEMLFNRCNDLNQEGEMHIDKGGQITTRGEWNLEGNKAKVYNYGTVLLTTFESTHLKKIIKLFTEKKLKFSMKALASSLVISEESEFYNYNSMTVKSHWEFSMLKMLIGNSYSYELSEIIVKGTFHNEKDASLDIFGKLQVQGTLYNDSRIDFEAGKDSVFIIDGGKVVNNGTIILPSGLMAENDVLTLKDHAGLQLKDAIIENYGTIEFGDNSSLLNLFGSEANVSVTSDSKIINCGTIRFYADDYVEMQGVLTNSGEMEIGVDEKFVDFEAKELFIENTGKLHMYITNNSRIDSKSTIENTDGGYLYIEVEKTENFYLSTIDESDGHVIFNDSESDFSFTGNLYFDSEERTSLENDVFVNYGNFTLTNGKIQLTGAAAESGDFKYFVQNHGTFIFCKCSAPTLLYGGGLYTYAGSTVKFEDTSADMSETLAGSGTVLLYNSDLTFDGNKFTADAFLYGGSSLKFHSLTGDCTIDTGSETEENINTLELSGINHIRNTGNGKLILDTGSENAANAVVQLTDIGLFSEVTVNVAGILKSDYADSTVILAKQTQNFAPEQSFYINFAYESAIYTIGQSQYLSCGQYITLDSAEGADGYSLSLHDDNYMLADGSAVRFVYEKKELFDNFYALDISDLSKVDFVMYVGNENLASDRITALGYDDYCSHQAADITGKIIVENSVVGEIAFSDAVVELKDGSTVFQITGGTKDDSVLISGTNAVVENLDLASGENTITVTGSVSELGLQWNGEGSVTVTFEAASSFADAAITLAADSAVKELTLDWSGLGYQEVRILVDDSNNFDNSDYIFEIKNGAENFTFDCSEDLYYRVDALLNGEWITHALADETAPDQVCGLHFDGTNFVWDECRDNRGGNGVSGYIIEIAADEAFTTLLDTQNIAAREYGYILPDGVTAVYARVKAIDFDNNEGIWSEIAPNALDITPPAVPEELTVQLDRRAAVLSWGTVSDDMTGIKEYTVCYSNGSENFTLTTRENSVTIENLSLGEWSWSVCAQDNAGNISDWASPQSFEIIPGTVQNLQGDSNGLSWDAIPEAKGYIVEYSTDDFATVMSFETTGTKVDSIALPEGTYQWCVRAIDSEMVNNGNNITSQNTFTEPQEFVSNADGNTDVFFANANGKWTVGYAAQHLGILNGWSGTHEQANLTGKNKLADIFEGSSDANILLLTDDANGDALFVDDIYTALPGTVAEQQARIAKIDEIRAGNGDDIVDMTSQRFAYIGDGMKIYGGLGNDTIWANNGNNALFGDAGNDRLVGGANNDVIVGGIGNDRMHGGGGDDIFTFGNNWGNDTIEQLDGGEITLWFESGEMSNWNADTLTYSDGTNSVKVSGVSNDNITLIFGDDGSLRYDELATVGCFDDAASEKIFEDKNKGMLA